ncbi:MAG: tellurite resistance TerB family protein [Rhodomicrobium sp.]|nr:tellurite resistance TerB family protein [Rhodomicrobium sp.]
MPAKPTIHEALIYAMVTMSAVDRMISDNELSKIGNIVSQLPVFADYDQDRLVKTAEACGNILSEEDGLDAILGIIAKALPKKLHETAYALAVEIAAVDRDVRLEELRFLEMLRDRLGLETLVVAAIERGARARHQIP